VSLFLGIDVGTSGCRSCVIDAAGNIQAETRTLLPAPRRNGSTIEQDPALWWSALAETLDALTPQVPMAAIEAIGLDGTSSTLLCCDSAGTPLAPALMYNDARAVAAAQRIEVCSPHDSAAHGASSSLAKLLWLLDTPAGKSATHALHQADWLLGQLSGRYGISDENNALKLGYDVVNRCWPDWLAELDIPQELLPEVVPAGRAIGTPDATACARWGFQPQARIVSGTTDSTASFIATGAQPGEAVTSLGSTLVLKVLADQPVFEPANGIYSHRLGDRWLVGGASNSGGAVLKQYFSDADIARLTLQLQPDSPTGLDYYPLVSPGERFPTNDPLLQPRLDPRPVDDTVFFQGILEGIAHIELEGYRRLAALGAPWPERVLTTGGGAANRGWGTLRAALLGVPVIAASHQEAAYGTALLARSCWHSCCAGLEGC
jgi:sugar (pentulose or hexulose) kinase